MGLKLRPVSFAKVGLINLLTTSVLLAGCAVSDEQSATNQQVRLIAHDSFVVTDEAVEQLRRQTGIDLVILTGGDAGALAGNAILNKGEVGADVLFGVDSALLSKVLDAGVFAPHGLTTNYLMPEFQAETAGGLVMPIDYGDVCLNIDRAWYEKEGIPAPQRLEDFAKSQYRAQLVVPDPASSSPGLAFLLATVSIFGEDGFASFWQSLKENEVLVVGDWTQAYVGNFTAGGGAGSRPAVVSYATSPPAEIIYASDPKPAVPKSAALTNGCYRQIEFAGVLSGATNPAGASQVVEWLVSEAVQKDIAETMFVLPVREGVELPEVFEKFAAKVTQPLTLEPALVAKRQSEWIKQWSKVMTN